MQNRAWSTLSIKSVDTAQRVIEGIASTPSPDRGGDSLDPMGAQFTLPMPLLWKHKEPIGEVFAADVRPDGIYIKAKISKVAANAPADLKDLLDKAWHSITAKPPLARGLSVGWAPVEKPTMAGRVARFAKWIWGETSVVIVPMNAEATILSVKSFDQSSHAASGTGPAVIPKPPGVTGIRRDRTMTISEQLTEQKALLQTKSARFADLELKDEQENGLDADELTERKALSDEVDALTAKVSRLSRLEAAQMAQGSTISYPGTATATPPTRTPIQFKTVELEKGTIFTRAAMAIAAGKGSMSDTMAYAKRWSGSPEVVQCVKAIEGTAFQSSPQWGAELVNPNTAMTEFVELLRAATIVGRVPGFRTVPFNIPIITQTGGSTFEWVGESGVKPVGELAFDRTTMPTSKVAGIVVLTEELIRLSQPSAEATVRRDLVEQCARFIDEQFIQSSVSAGANNPASITNSVSTPGAASGTDVGALLADLNAALAVFDSAENSADVVIVMTKALARGISTLRTSLDVRAFPEMTPTGGTLLGYQVIVSNTVDSGTIVLFQPSEIFLADDGRVSLDSSNQATLSMSGGSTTPDFNLWQRNCVGIRAERWIRWQKRRSDVVAVITSAAYGPAVGSP